MAKKKTRQIFDNEIHQMNYERRYESANAVLRFHYVATSASIRFHAYLTAMSETFNSRWQKTPVYGRMDNIANYEGTDRTLQLAWDIPSYSIEQARVHLSYVSELITYTYPVMDNSQGIGNINTPPILRLEFGNLIKDVSSNQGLLGFIDGGLSITPDLDAGMFMERGKFYPKNWKLSLSYSVLHTHKLGFHNKPKMPVNFPYEVPNDYHDQKATAEEFYKLQKEAPLEKIIGEASANAAQALVPGLIGGAIPLIDAKMREAKQQGLLDE